MSYTPSIILTTRAAKGAPLTHAEMDANLLILDIQAKLLSTFNNDIRYPIYIADALLSNRLIPIGSNAIDFTPGEAFIIPKGKFFTTDATPDYFYFVSVDVTDYGTEYALLSSADWPLNTALPFDIVVFSTAGMTVNFTVSDSQIGGLY